MPAPELPEIENTWNIVITGVGGTGVVTIGALLAQAAYIDGKGAGMMEMAGLAQKGGAVHIHCRIANAPNDIKAIRVSTGEADALIGGDLMVSAGAKTLGLTSAGKTGAVVNSHEIITGDFTRDTEFRLPSERLTLALQSRLQSNLALFDASQLARVVLGDSIFSNMMLLGAAWQKGHVPLTEAALRQAIELNGAAVAQNLRAFDVGRWAVLYGADAEKLTTSNVVPLPKTSAEKIASRVAHLTSYQSKRLARRYTTFLDGIDDAPVRDAALSGYHKVLAYKDEYEVARLLLSSREKAKAEFEGDFKLSFNLAPPMLSKTGPDGRPRKKEFGPWLERPLRVLARMKVLRRTPFDPFGYTAERRMERALIKQYETDMAEVLPLISERTREAIMALAELPFQINGFGPVKAAKQAKAAKRREELLSVIRAGRACYL